MPKDYPVYTGLRTYDGGIMQNGDRAQERENVLLNQMSYEMYFYRLLDLCMSVFEWTNLPKGVDARMLEYWLMRDGFCGFFYDEDLKTDERERAPEGYAVLPMMIQGRWDMYNYPTERRAYAVNGFNYECDETNSVLIFNDYLRVPVWTTLSIYAQRLAEIDRTIDVNVMNQKAPKVIRCDEKQRLTFKNLAMQAQGNVYWIMADKNVDLKDIDVLDMSSPYLAGELMLLKRQYWNEVLTFLGIENVTTEKKERLVSTEVMSNMGDVESQRFVRLNARKQACGEINEKFGLEVNCEFKSSIYIKAGGYGAQQIQTSGMRSSSVPSEGGNAGYGDDSSILAKIRNLIGMGGAQ